MRGVWGGLTHAAKRRAKKSGKQKESTRTKKSVSTITRARGYELSFASVLLPALAGRTRAMEAFPRPLLLAAGMWASASRRSSLQQGLGPGNGTNCLLSAYFSRIGSGFASGTYGLTIPWSN
ncbi:hypothetical protein SBBP2_890026 [Burkholderiales bacterium]|nr:hypothetical protein SBBP2_890026 [Burkholderiales bacterium]